MSLVVELKHRFEGPRAFQLAVEFTAAAGVTVLFGPSGSGKTTVLECIAGLIRPKTASIRLHGEELSRRRAGERCIGYLFQQPTLFPHMTVFGNVEYGLHSRADRQRVARSFLELFHVAQFADRRPESLSGGERQRVALARTLAVEPQALLLDEPLSALDAETTQSIIADLRTWNAERRIPIVYVTHSLQEALGLADAVVVLRSGSIIRQGSPTEVLATERHSLLQMLC